MNEIPHFKIKVPSDRINRDEARTMEEDFYFCIDRVSWIEQVLLKEEVDSLIDALVIGGLLAIKPQKYTYDLIREDRPNVQIILGNNLMNVQTFENHRPSFTNQ